VLRDHVHKVRSIRGLGQAKAIITVEENYGNDADIHWFMAHQYNLHNYEFVRNRKNQVGFHTSNPSKRSMVYAMDDIIVRGALSFHTHMITSRGRDPQFMRERFITQLMGIKRRVKMGRTQEDEPIEYFSGKMGNQQDDLPWAFMFNLMSVATVRHMRMEMDNPDLVNK